MGAMLFREEAKAGASRPWGAPTKIKDKDIT
jgi:hypothetical protein